MVSLFIGSALMAMQASEPKSNEITVYNQGFGLVKEYRTLGLKAGRQTVAIEDVAAQIQPSSVGFHSISADGSINVLEQNYQYDLISTQEVLNKAVGSKIRLVRTLPNSSEQVLTGTLMSSPTAIVDSNGTQQYTYNGMVLKTDDGRIILDPTGTIEVESIPEGMISRPTLLWDIDSAKAGDNTIELSYLTHGMTWSADYVLTIDEIGKADLQGWVTMNNESGARFKDVRLKLLAGDINQVPTERPEGAVRLMAKAAPVSAPQFQEQSLFEYHLYTLQRPTTLNNKETKQISLLEGHGIEVQKKMIVDSMLGSGEYYPSEGVVGVGDFHPQVRLEFKNSKENDLGIPLPAGKIKIYERDGSGSVQMLGEDQIGHTPRDEKLSLVVGRSFDVVASRKRLSFHRINDRDFQETFEITVRNHKDVNQGVILLERHYGDWSVTDTSDKFSKEDANTMQYTVGVPSNGEKVVKYTVETKW
jgi:hypothetical protein